MSKFHVIIPAAGRSSRIGQDTPKQFIRIGDKTILEYIEGVFARIQSIDSIFIALNSTEKNSVNANYKFSRKTKVLHTGGENRSQTILNTLIKISDGITEFIINQFINDISLDKVGGILALPVPDTVKKVNKKLEIISTENRNVLWLAQTPQMFRYKKLKQAIEEFQGSPTDEAEAIEAMGLKPKLFKGNAQNFKITYPEDLIRAQNALQIMKKGEL